MESEGNDYGVSGYVPEFGAIFMSNTATKEECFRRKLLGLPSGKAHFVKQVKAGMLLFLFEFNGRKLYGVFRATSNGAMNIVPNAFSSSGKQFPAQVKFTCLWHCNPLSEDEFSDAIRENYFSTKKFNFGLSEDQVHKLLYLFSLRKLKPQRHFSRHSMKKSRRAADDDVSKLGNKVEDELDCDGSHGSAISTNYFGTHLSKGGADSSVHNQFEPSSTVCHPRELQVLKLLCPTSNGHAISLLPYDPDNPSIDSRLPLSHDFAPPHSSNAGNIPSSGNQSYLSYEVPQVTRSFAYFNTGLGNSISVPSPNCYESSWSSTIPLLEAAYPEDRATNSCENEGYTGSPVARPFSAPVCFSDGGNVDRMIEGPHSFSPSHYPSFVLGYEHHGASQEKDHKMAQCGINESFLANASKSKDGQNQLQGGPYTFEFKSTDQHVSSSFKPNGCHNSEGMYSDFQKKRESVFSRLTLASKAHSEENGSHGDDIETSVNEVMSMLHHSHHQWLMRKQTFVDSKPFKHRIQKISNDLKTDDIPDKEGNCEFAEMKYFVDFRRRSDVQKIHNETGGCNGSAESEGISDGLQKRRKLNRPNFNNVLPDNKNVSVETPQNVEMSHVSGQTNHKEKDIIEVETVSNCKGEEMGETCGAL